jgi:hypothetical protein
LFLQDFSERSEFPDTAMHGAIQSVAPLRDWLLIETFVFYVYIHSTVFFIAGHQIKSWFSKKYDTETDIKKTETDFIIYSRDSLVWFSYNFVNIVMPLMIVFMAKYRASLPLEVCPSSILHCGPFDENDNLYKWVFIGLASSQLLQMILNSKLYELESLPKEFDIYTK